MVSGSATTGSYVSVYEALYLHPPVQYIIIMRINVLHNDRGLLKIPKSRLATEEKAEFTKQ
jgi:hypothetical protein